MSNNGRARKSNCRCSRCGTYSKQWKWQLNRVGGVSCACCGGNVLLARYVHDGDLDRSEVQRVKPSTPPEGKKETSPLRRTKPSGRRRAKKGRHNHKQARLGYGDGLEMDREFRAIIGGKSETTKFMELVDCRESEVKNIPEGRLAGYRAHIAELEKEGRRLSGDHPMPFGKHRGKLLRDVPADYLHWLAKAPDDENSTVSGRRFKRELRFYLHGDAA